MQQLTDLYQRYVIGYPKVVLLVLAVVVGFLALQLPKFHLDASSDALVLEHDKSLEYYRSVKARYGSDDYLIVTYTPQTPLFDSGTLQDLKSLRDKLEAIDRVEQVISMLDVPLLQNAEVSATGTVSNVRTLQDPFIDIAMAKEELLGSPLYSDLLINQDATTAAILVNFYYNERYHELLKKRNKLREAALSGPLSTEQSRLLKKISADFDQYKKRLLVQERADIAHVRSIMQEHAHHAKLHLGGVPVIVADSMSFIESDIRTFGIGVVCFIIIILALAFHSLLWVALPLTICMCVGVAMVGFLGLTGWPVTVVSSNFISLLLIITLSITIHLIVRYREFQVEKPKASQEELVSDTVNAMFEPCFYTATTTIVAFGSLIVSNIRPVIDFGWMMAIGISVAFIIVFLMFPAVLLMLKPRPINTFRDITGRITHWFAETIQTYDGVILSVFAVLVVFSVMGIRDLTVENRFIDYYKKSTDIYQGMELIDKQLGGTTPLEIILDAPPVEVAEEEWEDPFMAKFAAKDQMSGGYWFNTFMLEDIARIHAFLDSLPETGKVLSLATTKAMVESAYTESAVDAYTLAILYQKLPEDIRDTLFTPYVAKDGDQVRFTMRVFESDPELRRQKLIEKIRAYLEDTMRLKPDQVHITGMLVLYNNMLNSLFDSQIMTIGFVFLAILAMFVVLFRNVTLAMIAIIPNIIAAGTVLGIMGLFGIPLDLMTITIAAICIGIGVDDTIHYVHRYMREFAKDRNYQTTITRSHNSIGRAMYYTTVTITLGFSILALSNFVPTIYFGILTGLSMVVALLANLSLLAVLIAKVKPLG